jgi:hypothetical protein
MEATHEENTTISLLDIRGGPSIFPRSFNETPSMMHNVDSIRVDVKQLHSCLLHIS